MGLIDGLISPISSDVGVGGSSTTEWADITSTPTTLVGYGITDAQPLDADLTAIAALTGTGVLRRTGVDTWALGTDGLLYFDEAESAALGGKRTNSFTAISADASANAALIPKGNGAIVTGIPDETATGGNQRGLYAVDFQMLRSTANQVASGDYSFVAGNSNAASGNYSFAAGDSNTASGSHSFAAGASNTASSAGSVAFGQTNTASGGFSFVAGQSNTASATGSFAAGQLNTASATGSVAIGFANQALGSRSMATGQGNVISGSYSFAAGQGNDISSDFSTAIGRTNTASGIYSMAIGDRANTFSRTGFFSQASGLESTSGDSQRASGVFRNRTLDATPTLLTSDSLTTASAQNIYTLQNRQGCSGQIMINAIRKGSEASEDKTWIVNLRAYRGANAAATTVTVINTVADGSTGTEAWTLTVQANTTIGGWQILVTGESAKSIQWTAAVTAVENIYI